MCGIAGIWHRGSDQAVDRRVLENMAQTMWHRGPDSAGVFTKKNFGMAHRRLAVLDVSTAGHQPMVTSDERYALVFNGEIYNFRELRARYLTNVALRSSSDTEVLLHLLARRGAAVLPELRGMFALAFWDVPERQLLLARDPFGKKPLYWARRRNTFAFASEVKALLAMPAIRAEIDPLHLVKYFSYEYVPAPATGYRNIWQLPMGHCALVTEGAIDIEPWWKPTYQPKHTFGTELEARNVFDKKLKVAVERRLVSDVPVGVLLSGGLDSTTIGWYMKQCSSEPLHSFSVSFAEGSFDEGSYARLAARALGTEHHDMQFGIEEFHESLAALVPLMDVPLGDASLLPTWAVSKMARSSVTVALDGDGSDELLGGYGTFQAAVVADRLPRLSPPVTAGLEKLLRALPTRYTDFSFDFKVKSFARGLRYSRARRNQVWLGSFTESELLSLLQPSWHDLSHLTNGLDEAEARSADLSVIDAVSWLTVHGYLHNDILVKLDRAAMFVSLEARTPFLDVDLAEWLMRLPTSFKHNKYLLKQMMRQRIPTEIIDRPKKGFGLPLGFWLRGPLYDWARSVLHPDKLRRDGILVATEVHRLLGEHKAGRADHRKKLWTLLAFQLWHDEWIR